MIRSYQRSWTVPWAVIMCLIAGVKSQERQGYLIAAPSVFRAGVEEAVSVTLFNTEEETRVQVQLSVKGETVAHSHGTVRDKGTIKLKVPSDLRGQATLKVWGNQQLTEGGYIFHNHTTVTVDSKGTAVFIQTDKPIYKPQHKVLINVYSITPDLRPANDKIEAYVVVSEGHVAGTTPVAPGALGFIFSASGAQITGLRRRLITGTALQATCNAGDAAT